MTEKRFEVETSENQDTIFDNECPDDYYHLGNDTRDVQALCKLLNELHEENQQLKILTKPVQDAIIKEFTITKEDISNNQRITELTKRNDIAGWKLRPYIIRVETYDLDFLNFMDKKLDELIDEFYRDDNND